MIELIHVSKFYHRLRAVDDLNLKVRPGTIFGFIGPNGAGKTTTIKMITGIIRPSSGSILVNQWDIADQAVEAKRCIGYIPDRPFLYEKLTGFEFLRFVNGLYGLSQKRNLENKINELLELFDLMHWADELIESYSHGMKQRLVMCQALLHEPLVLVVDEPLVGLDPRGARLVKDLFREKSRQGMTIFMSTHSLELAQEVCDEIAIIEAGKIIAQGTAAELQASSGIHGNLEAIFLKLTEGKNIAHATSLSASQPHVAEH